jgi:hypothetical protein
MKGAIWRLLRVRVGPRLFDDGCAIPERTLVSIGSNCSLNVRTVIQCHSMEEGIFKTDRTTLGAGCTVGVNAFVHYGVTMGEGTVLEADSFLMKGGRTAPGSVWAGNPASRPAPHLQLLRRSVRPWWRRRSRQQRGPPSCWRRSARARHQGRLVRPE